MDLYLNVHSTDLCDSNSESSYTACKVFGHMLSKKIKVNEKIKYFS